MPYKNKKDDREWHRNHMRQKRSVTPVTPDVTPDKAKRLETARKAMLHPVKPKTGAPQSKSSGSNGESGTPVSYRSGMRYKPGTRLVLSSGEIVTAPELDGDGNPIW